MREAAIPSEGLSQLQAAADVLRTRLRKRGVAICLSGIDGSGKTTLAQQLVHALENGGVPARYLHVYQWYLNVMWMPLVLLYNRYVGRTVLALDRSIFDNIAVVALSRRSPSWLPRIVLAMVRSLYPRFDYRFYLAADYPEILRRRPGTSEQRFAELTAVYDRVAARAGHVRLASDTALFDAVLSYISKGVQMDRASQPERSAGPDHTKGWQSSKVAEAYDARRFRSLGGRFYDLREKKVIGELLAVAEQRAPVREVLEMASGTGRLSELLAARGYTLTCGDISREMQEVAERRLAGARGGSVRFRILDIYNIAEPDGAFDCACAFRLFQHLTSDERARALRELARVSRRFVMVNVMYTSAYYGAVRRLRQAFGRYTTRYTSSKLEIDAELQFAGLSLVRSVFTQPGFNGNLVLLAEKRAAKGG